MHKDVVDDQGVGMQELGMLVGPRTPVWRWATAVAIAGSVALCADVDRAGAAVGPQGIRPGHNITVFHNIDFVAAFGHGSGQAVRVDIVRGGHRIATAGGPAVQLGPPEGGALEVNHGPVGRPLPGDCWEGATPDVHPGDLIRVTSGGGVDEVIVDDISIDSISRQPGPNTIAGDNDDQIWVEGVARSGADGTPIAAGVLDSGEFRDPLNNQLRMEPNEVVEGTAGRYTAKYRAPFRFVKGSASIQDALTALQRDGHAFGYGHLPLANGALRPDAMLVEGLGGNDGPALGCEVAPAETSSAGATSAEAINIAHVAGLADTDVALTVGGWAASTVANADVELRDAAGATVVRPVAGLTGGATAQQGWSATYTKAQIAGLAQGALTARLLVAGAPLGATKTIRHDTVAPAAPTAAPAAGTHTGTQVVELSAEPGAAIHYTVDGGTPTTSSARFGGGLLVERDTTIRAIAIDAAGNASPAATLAFAIRAASPAPALVPGVAVLGTSASSPATAAAAASARPAVTLRVSRLSAPARLSAVGARRNGLVASFVAPRGAEYAEARLYRLDGTGRTLVARKAFATSAGRRVVARFTSAAIRRKLKAGRYVLEARTGPQLGLLGPVVASSVRIAR